MEKFWHWRWIRPAGDLQAELAGSESGPSSTIGSWMEGERIWAGIHPHDAVRLRN